MTLKLKRQEANEKKIMKIPQIFSVLENKF